jgi:6-pyruvoyl-tetrahydropterin synthase
MYIVTKEFNLYYAHVNRALGGKCARLHGHGAKIVVSVQEPLNLQTSVTMEFCELENVFNKWKLKHDHYTLIYEGDSDILATFQQNDCLKNSVKVMPLPTSAENMAKMIFDFLKNEGLNVVEVAFKETFSSSVKYKGPC